MIFFVNLVTIGSKQNKCNCSTQLYTVGHVETIQSLRQCFSFNFYFDSIENIYSRIRLISERNKLFVLDFTIRKRIMNFIRAKFSRGHHLL